MPVSALRLSRGLRPGKRNAVAWAAEKRFDHLPQFVVEERLGHGRSSCWEIHLPEREIRIGVGEIAHALLFNEEALGSRGACSPVVTRSETWSRRPGRPSG